MLDRTQWSIGTREVNYLVLAVVTRRFRVPLLWTLLPGSGNSSTAARIALIERYLAHFPASTIGVLLADREFIGADWLKFLNDNNIPFAIRLREDLRVTDRGRPRAHPLRPPAPRRGGPGSSAAGSARATTPRPATHRSRTSPPSASRTSG